MKIFDGQEITILEFEGSDYFKDGDAGQTFEQEGKPVTPVVDECEVDGNQEIEFGQDYIVDNHGQRYLYIIGGRPRTRSRK